MIMVLLLLKEKFGIPWEQINTDPILSSEYLSPYESYKLSSEQDMVTSGAVGRAALPDSEARHLDYAHKRRLGEILDVNDAWKDFMARIKMPHDPSSPRFTSEDIQILDR